MTGARADAFTELLKRVIGKSANASPKNAVLLACVCVPLAVTTSVALRDVDHVHYLPLFGAVMATALVGSRTATLFVIGVSIAAAVAYRHALAPDATAYRLIHGEGRSEEHTSELQSH